MKKITSVLIIVLLLVFVICEFLPREVIEPIYYSKEISQKAKEYNIDPFIIAAVARTESSWVSSASSSVGARGLMQVMPDTGLFLAELRGLELDIDELYDPLVSLDYGTYYLKMLYDEFGDWDLVYAAYNAGPGQVRAWLEDEDYSSNGRLTYIPFEETRNYVDKVNRHLENFKKSYKKFPQD